MSIQARPEEIGASPRVQEEWLSRVEAEYQSAAITQHLGLWLIQSAVSPDLIRDALTIVDDEMAHAEMAYGVYSAAGGMKPPRLDRENLGLAQVPGIPLEEQVLRVCLRTYCLGETIAVPLFANLRRHCSEPSAKRALDRVLVDEVRHRDFGWTLLSWLIDTQDESLIRSIANESLPPMLSELRSIYAAFPDDRTITDADRAWGLAPGADYAEIFDRTLTRDFTPRFNALGITI